MKSLKLLALACLVLLFAQCKSTAPTSSGTSAASVLEVANILDSTQAYFLAFAEQTNGNPQQAIGLTTNWLQSQSNVQSATTMDSSFIDITLKSGLATTFSFAAVDASGNYIFRGGGNPVSNGTAELSGTKPLSQNIITNKKVLIFAADTKSLLGVEPQIQKDLTRFANSGLGLDVTVLRDEQCTYNIVEHFGDYGLVIINTHGSPQSFLLGTPIDLSTVKQNEASLKAALNQQIGAGAYDKIASGDLLLAATDNVDILSTAWWKTVKIKQGLLFSAKYVDELPPMPNTIIFGNMCYSGWSLANTARQTYTHPIKTAFANRNPISYYGYVTDWRAIGNSRPVPDTFAAHMEDEFVHRLVESADSTKIANLQSDNVTEFADPEHFDRGYGDLWGNLAFRHWGSDTYSYEKSCIDTFRDARDGHLYHAVCIGKQIWMSENLDYDLPGSECYDSLSSNCDKYGKLYRRSMVMNGASPTNANPSGVQGICPKGWHVPSAAEWQQLIAFLGDSTTAGGALKAVSPLWAPPNSRATNSSGFTALPGGEWVDGDAAASTHLFFNKNLYEMFHMCTELHPGQIDLVQLDYNSTLAHWFTYAATTPPVYAGNGACRCVKDP